MSNTHHELFVEAPDAQHSNYRANFAEIAAEVGGLTEIDSYLFSVSLFVGTLSWFVKIIASIAFLAILGFLAVQLDAWFAVSLVATLYVAAVALFQDFYHGVLEKNTESTVKKIEQIGDLFGEALDNLHENTSLLTKQNEKLTEQNNVLSEQNVQLKEEIEQLKEEVEKFRCQVETLSQEVEKLNNEVGEFKNQNQLLSCQVKELTEKNSELEKITLNMKNLTIQLKQQIAKMPEIQKSFEMNNQQLSITNENLMTTVKEQTETLDGFYDALEKIKHYANVLDQQRIAMAEASSLVTSLLESKRKDLTENEINALKLGGQFENLVLIHSKKELQEQMLDLKNEIIELRRHITELTDTLKQKKEEEEIPRYQETKHLRFHAPPHPQQTVEASTVTHYVEPRMNG